MSNETPKPSPKKTKWAHRFAQKKWFLAAVALAIAALCAPFFFVQQPGTVLRLGHTDFQLEVAATEAARERGLSNRDSLPADHGMLFVFDAPEKSCFWMKDTRFPLDMVWLNAQKRVVYVAENVLPASYPNSVCTSTPASYVLELNAGVTAQYHVELGQRLQF